MGWLVLLCSFSSLVYAHKKDFCCWWSHGDRDDWCKQCPPGQQAFNSKEQWCKDGGGVWCHDDHPPSPTPTPPPPPPPSPPVPPPPTPPPPGTGQCWLTSYLNQQIDWSGSVERTSVYTKGKGVLVRSPFDGYEDDTSKQVVPATLWTNDIFAPSQLYPGSGPTQGNPWCPTQNAPWTCETDWATGDDSPWDYAQLAVVMGTKMGNLFYDFENIQSQDWGWGVFYASDSNSVDQRCHYIDQYEGYDCPGGWISWGEDFAANNEKLGSGGYPAGNPQAGLTSGGGGGAGCHFDNGGIDQIDAYTDDGQNLVQDRDCQCNYAFNGDWGKWVDNWLYNSFLGGDKTASWALDIAACWVNNPRDMIMLQNQLWWRRWDWNDQTVPKVAYGSTPSSNRAYWGWNEIPMSREQVADKRNWDAVLVKLPAGVCGGNGGGDALMCFDSRYHPQLERDLEGFVNAGYLAVGAGSQDLDAQPSSNVVIAREYIDQSGNYFREFFCESWTSPSGKYQIVFQPQDSTRAGGCYLEWGGSSVHVV